MQANSEPAPMLAREYYNVDSEDSDSDNSSLLILPKKAEKKNLESPRNINHCYQVTNADRTVSNLSQAKKPPPDPAANLTKRQKNRIYPSDSVTKFPSTSDSDTNDDDDDDFLLMKSKRVFEKKEDRTKRMKREREEQKEKEKQERIRKRKELKEEKERRKAEENLAKKRQNEEHYQATGKYSHEEIAVLLDTDLHNDPNGYGLVERLSADFLVQL